MLFLGERDVEALLDDELAMTTSDEAFVLAAGGGVRARSALRVPGRYGALLLASAHDGAGLSVKSNIHVHPAGGGPRRSESLLSLWSLETGEVEALIAARIFNDWRTAGGLAAGARRLVRGAPARLVVFGTGKIAGPTARAFAHAFPSLERITIAGRTARKADLFAARLSGDSAFAGREVVGVGPDAARRAVAEASVIVTVTSASEPVVFGEDVPSGSLVILAGANRPDAREADDALIRRAEIYCDTVENVFEKAGDLGRARDSGALGADIAIRPVGAAPGERAPADSSAPWAPDIVVFKSIGLGEQDLLLARALVRRAVARGTGLWIDAETGVHQQLSAARGLDAKGETSHTPSDVPTEAP
ncbi:hypothetical protein DLJ53_30105 [Acuticoccus sediminis]|uniref:Ornithine cyclodeaminase n=1 Tax=Acuticoccus sediminis TaxID=2184697 RepID=A0A8B2NF10_9HYPH|nr:ornithine cyclodeaminase family protein [Acuticoccus sediminis]RAH97447.1 hypothetical protein DLJ53_30105 [Acuticoccus sediminis]